MPNIVFEHLEEHINLISLRENKPLPFDIDLMSTLKEFEKFSLIFSNCNPFPSVPSAAKDDRK